MMHMDFYGKKNLWKLILFFMAVLIGAATLWYTETFLAELRAEEVKKVERLGEAMKSAAYSEPEDNITFELSFIQANQTIPIIVTDGEGNIITVRNIDASKAANEAWVRKRIAEMELEADPIVVDFGKGQVNIFYYENSSMLTKLRFYPIILLCVIFLFVIIAYIAFSNSRKAEQNQVWNGLAKETAHQIGTPLTSLMGWMELLREKETEPVMVAEMEKDISRLRTITDRFSKIGSKPKLDPHSIKDVCREAVTYLKNRAPRKIDITYHEPDNMEELKMMLNKPLFEWVVENLIRNAIDAIEGAGKIDVYLLNFAKYIRIEVVDTGKGIPANQHRAIFRPGFTTKSRGWGLGLSLAKRIVEDYHGGRIFVAKSEPGGGSTFRIQLKK
jgi:signal transduction histidine kinase